MRELWNGWTRAALVVFGGLLILQSSDALDFSKQLYLAIALVAVLGSVWAVIRIRRDEIVRLARPWLVFSGIVAAILAISLPVAIANGVQLDAWIRDAAAYGLVAAAPWLAVDAAASATARSLWSLLMAGGVISVVSFAVEWIERRGLADLPIDRIGLPSFLFASAFFAFTWAWGESSAARGRWTWLAVGAVTLGLLLLTGTRSTLLLLAVPAALGLVQLRQKAWRSVAGVAGRAVLQVCGALLVVVAGQLALANWADAPGVGPSGAPGSPDRPDVVDRIDVDDIVSGADNSFRERQAQYRAALAAFADAPLIGQGPGYTFTWPNYAGDLRHTTTLDTGLVVLAKFGLLGAVMFIAMAAAFGQLTILTLRRRGFSGESLLLVGYGSAAALWLPLGWPVEDKGFGLALVFVLGVAFLSISTTPNKAQRNGALAAPS